MSKKTLLKTTAIVVCFAFLLLSSPGLTSARTKHAKLDLSNIIKKPVAFFSSLLSFLPFNSTGMDAGDDSTSTRDPSKKIKITGDLNCGRASDGD